MRALVPAAVTAAVACAFAPFGPAAAQAGAKPVAGLVCLMAVGDDPLPVFPTSDAPAPANWAAPVLLAVRGPDGAPNARGGRTEIRTPSNREGWVESAKLKPYRSASNPKATCTPVASRAPDGSLLLGFR